LKGLSLEVHGPLARGQAFLLRTYCNGLQTESGVRETTLGERQRANSRESEHKEMLPDKVYGMHLKTQNAGVFDETHA